MTVEAKNEDVAAIIQQRGRLNWGAIWGGSLASMGLWVLLALFGLAIGLSAVNPNSPNLKGVAVWLGVWSLIVPILSLFPGVLLAGRAARVEQPLGGVMHGLVVWGLTTFASALLILGGAWRVAMLTAAAGPAAPTTAGNGEHMALVAVQTLGANLWWQWGGVVLGLGTALVAGAMAARKTPSQHAVPVREPGARIPAGA